MSQIAASYMTASEGAAAWHVYVHHYDDNNSYGRLLGRFASLRDAVAEMERICRPEQDVARNPHIGVNHVRSFTISPPG